MIRLFHKCRTVYNTKTNIIFRVHNYICMIQYKKYVHNRVLRYVHIIFYALERITNVLINSNSSFVSHNIIPIIVMIRITYVQCYAVMHISWFGFANVLSLSNKSYFFVLPLPHAQWFLVRCLMFSACCHLVQINAKPRIIPLFSR